MAVVTIFGNADCKENSEEYNSAFLLGRLLSFAGFDIATGGYDGVMEAALKGAGGSDARRIGVILDGFEGKKPNDFVGEKIIVDTYLQRLQALIETGDAYVVMPGGTGTLLEFSALWALKSKEIIGDKLIICIGEQWDQIKQTMGFYSEVVIDNMQLVSSLTNVEEAAEIVIREFEKK